MQTIELLDLPTIRFAHCYEAQQYRNRFAACKDTLEISYIFDGALTYRCGEETIVAEAGDIICIPRDVESEVRADGYHCHHTFSFGGRWEWREDSQGLYLPCIVRHCAETEEVARMIDEIIFSGRMYDRSVTKSASCVLNILCKIDAIARDAEKIAVPERVLLAEKAKQYIQRQITHPITQTEVAEHLGVSCGYLCSVFKKSEGISLIKYVNTLKLKGVYALIKKEGCKLYEAAATYGYSDPNYVSALYKRMFGQNITES